MMKDPLKPCVLAAVLFLSGPMAVHAGGEWITQELVDLTAAISNGDRDALQRALAAGASAEGEFGDGTTVLQRAALTGAPRAERLTSTRASASTG